MKCVQVALWILRPKKAEEPILFSPVFHPLIVSHSLCPGALHNCHLLSRVEGKHNRNEIFWPFYFLVLHSLFSKINFPLFWTFLFKQLLSLLPPHLKQSWINLPMVWNRAPLTCHPQVWQTALYWGDMYQDVHYNSVCSLWEKSPDRKKIENPKDMILRVCVCVCSPHICNISFSCDLYSEANVWQACIELEFYINKWMF